jgi:hypothetical protein
MPSKSCDNQKTSITHTSHPIASLWIITSSLVTLFKSIHKQVHGAPSVSHGHFPGFSLPTPTLQTQWGIVGDVGSTTYHPQKLLTSRRPSRSVKIVINRCRCSLPIHPEKQVSVQKPRQQPNRWLGTRRPFRHLSEENCGFGVDFHQILHPTPHSNPQLH